MDSAASLQNVAAESDRFGTSTDSIVPEESWSRTIRSVGSSRWQMVLQSFNESFSGKIKAIFMFFTLPCYAFVRPVLVRRPQRYKISHAGIIYFYILLSCTIVFNLWEQRVTSNSEQATSFQILQYFEITCMVVAILLLLYVDYATRGRIIYGNRDRKLIIYFRIGLYVFGIPSFLYSLLNAINYSYCVNGQQIILNVVKTAYIAAQIVFLNCFYLGKLPNDRQLLQIALAHVLGTNLGLWLWTLCQEVYEPPEEDKRCKSHPVHLDNTEKYFNPIFVEYLLLVASMMYELWTNIDVPNDGARHSYSSEPDNYPYYCRETQFRIAESASEIEQPSEVPVLIQRTSQAGCRRSLVPSLVITLILGLMLSALFIVAVYFADHAGAEGRVFPAYFIISECIHLCQIFACYVILVCRRSQRVDDTRAVVVMDDTLLYIGLAGIVLWESFHFYALFFCPTSHNVEFSRDVLAIAEDITQTVTLVSARRYRSRNDSNARTISNCALFLLATNIAMWAQDSFWIEEDILNPGDHHELFVEKLRVFGYILNPIIIFFRFHSATCFYQLWSIFTPAHNE